MSSMLSRMTVEPIPVHDLPQPAEVTRRIRRVMGDRGVSRLAQANSMHNTDPIAEWTVWQYSKSHSRRTIRERTRIVTRCAAASAASPDQLTATHIVEWLADETWSPSTRWTYHQALFAWHKWLQLVGHRTDNPMATIGAPRRPRGIPHPIADEHLPVLLAAARSIEHRAMILLAALQGFRVSEIAAIKGEHVDITGRTISVLGKGSVRSVLPLHPLVSDVSMELPRRGYWFPSDRPAGHYHGISVSNAIRKTMSRAGVPGTPHSLRHWYGTTLLAEGADLRTVQELLRHANVATTQIYTQVSASRKVEALNTLNPYRAGRNPKVA